MNFLTVSLIQFIKENKGEISKERKAKRQAKLAREIAQKQAELDKLTNTPKI